MRIRVIEMVYGFVMCLLDPCVRRDPGGIAAQRRAIGLDWMTVPLAGVLSVASSQANLGG